MLSKIVLTLEQDEERGTNEAMEETVAILATLDVMPMMKLVLTLECEEVSAERYRTILRTALHERPIGIIAKFKTTTEEEVTRVLMPPVTPMDKAFGNLIGGGIDEVTLSSAGRSVTLTAETARNAHEMLDQTTGERAKEWAERTRRLHVVPNDEEAEPKEARYSNYGYSSPQDDE